jgi:hypothetical protein
LIRFEIQQFEKELSIKRSKQYSPLKISADLAFIFPPNDLLRRYPQSGLENLGGQFGEVFGPLHVVRSNCLREYQSAYQKPIDSIFGDFKKMIFGMNNTYGQGRFSFRRGSDNRKGGKMVAMVTLSQSGKNMPTSETANWVPS